MITAISPTDAVERVRLLDRQRIDATKANDVRALRDLIDDDLVYIGKAGAIGGKSILSCSLTTSTGKSATTAADKAVWQHEQTSG
jgi:hypothetical protein